MVASLVPAANKYQLLAIDGRGGAGKSTLAKQLKQQIPATHVVHLDDFYRVIDPIARDALSLKEAYEQNYDWQRLEHQVLVPLSVGRPVRYERYDWPTNQLAETISWAPDQLVVIEGVGALRPELRGYYDCSVWIETPPKECLRRLIARQENSREQIDRWAAVEQFYIEHHHPDEAAKFIISGE